MPKVSVVIPLFNQKRYVGEAIKSVLCQTCNDIEIIVVNDGSTDSPQEVLSKFQDKITILDQNNKGLSNARNTGIKASSGEYIQLLDADDLLNPDKIRLQLNFCRTNNSLISYCETAFLKNDTGKFYGTISGPVEDIFYLSYNLWHPYPLIPHSPLIHRTVFEKYTFFDETFMAWEDRLFFCSLAHRGVRFDYFPYVGAYYRRHGSNMSGRAEKMLEWQLELHNKLNAELGDGFFKERYGFSGRQLRDANATFLYTWELGNNADRKTLISMKNVIKKYGVKFTVDAFPHEILPVDRKFRQARYFQHFYRRRLEKKITAYIK